MLVEWRQITQRMEVSAGGILATLVRVEGSSYRRVGARLLVADAGEQAGSISGGCLEGELLHRAKWLIRKGPAVQHYSTAIDDTDEIPYGLGCGGELDVLLEDVNSDEVRALFAEVKQVLAGAVRRVVTWLPGGGRELRRVIFEVGERPREDAAESFRSVGLSAEEVAWAAGLAPGEGGEGIFVEELRPPQRLIVLGAGEDARPMVMMAATLGWNVIVADGRRQLVRAERFHGAQHLIALETPEQLHVGPEDAVILMTHSYEQDRELLTAVLPAWPRYVGLLGARHRSSLLISEVAERLGWPIAQCCERLHAPVGLDLGGDGAEAIALAAIAEIQATVQGRRPSSRRLTAADVIEQVRRGDAGQYLQAQCALDRV